jgi:hypothetical protein
MGTEGPLPGGEAWMRHDADHSLLSSAEVVNEQELYILSPCTSIRVLWDSFTFTFKDYISQPYKITGKIVSCTLTCSVSYKRQGVTVF